jgi:hypothetical protein
VSDEARALEVRPEPTGASHEVAPTEMFFSTTDQRGVITDANSVFVRLSRYPLPSLLNAPHSIIRHPDMPGGAFEVMWQTSKPAKGERRPIRLPLWVSPISPHRSRGPASARTSK